MEGSISSFLSVIAKWIFISDLIVNIINRWSVKVRIGGGVILTATAHHPNMTTPQSVRKSCSRASRTPSSRKVALSTAISTNWRRTTRSQWGYSESPSPIPSASVKLTCKNSSKSSAKLRGLCWSKMWIGPVYQRTSPKIRRLSHSAMWFTANIVLQF